MSKLNDRRWGKLSSGEQPIIHRLKRAIPKLEEMIKDGSLKGKFKTPDNLTIVTCHNYKEEPLLEKNLKFLGLKYTVLRETRVPFKYVYKLERMVEFLEKKKKTPYVLFCDASDTIIIDDPDQIVKIFESKNCDLLFAGSLSQTGVNCTPYLQEWYRKIGRYGRYLNSGVYIGKWEFTLEVLKEACHFITPDSLTNEEYNSSGRGQFGSTRICYMLPNYPYRAPDQDILRFLLPNYYPRMQFDLKNELVYRN